MEDLTDLDVLCYLKIPSVEENKDNEKDKEIAETDAAPKNEISYNEVNEMVTKLAILYMQLCNNSAVSFALALEFANDAANEVRSVFGKSNRERW